MSSSTGSPRTRAAVKRVPGIADIPQLRPRRRPRGDVRRGRAQPHAAREGPRRIGGDGERPARATRRPFASTDSGTASSRSSTCASGPDTRTRRTCRRRSCWPARWVRWSATSTSSTPRTSSRRSDQADRGAGHAALAQEAVPHGRAQRRQPDRALRPAGRAHRQHGIADQRLTGLI